MLTIASLRARGEDLSEDLERETYLALAGLKPGMDLQSIYARYADITGPEALSLAIDAFKAARQGGGADRSAAMLLDWQIDVQSSRALALLDERAFEWESSANVTLPNGTVIPFRMIEEAWSKASNRAERLLMESTRAILVETQLAPLKLERLRAELAFVSDMNLGDTYANVFERLSGIAVETLCLQSTAFLAETQDMWDDLRNGLVRRVLDIDPRDASRADVSLLVRHEEFDHHFSFNLDGTLTRLGRELGLDPTAGGRISFDTERRATKLARPHCASVRVPQEIYLVVQPQGGLVDLHDSLHEFGHALHRANTGETLGFEFRRLGDNSVTEAYAMLLDHLRQDPEWLSAHSTLRGKELKAFLRAQAFNELYFVRRYMARLLYEAELYSAQADWKSLPDRYASLLSSATGFRFYRSGAFVDLDPRLYVVRYLRAWQLQAMLREVLAARFGSQWWRNPQAGPWMKETMWFLGQSESADELSVRVCGQPLSFDALIESIRQMVD